MLPSSKLLERETSDVTNEPTTPRNPPTGPPPPLPSIVIDDVEGNDDDPPPYSTIAPPDHVGWPFGFSRIQYSACRTAYREDAPPLERFQTSLTPDSGFRPEGTDQHASISMPLMPYRLFMCGSRRSLFGHGTLPFSDDTSVSKDDRGRTRKYGAILVGAAVIIFLMVLSLLVRFVMDKNIWRG